MRHLKQIFFIGFLLVSLFCFASCVAELVRDSPQFFGYRGDGLFEIYVARLDGQGFRSIVSDSWRQMSHPRISPDGQWLTFTRYNRRCRDGLAIEDGADYSASEIVIARIDGSAVRSLTPPSPVTANANSSWVDGGSALIYCHCSGRHALPELRKIDVRKGRITHVPTPTGWIVADPHELRGKIVFTVIPSENKKGDLADSLW